MTSTKYKAPMTVVAPLEQVTPADMAARIITTRETHGDILQQYHETWYNAPHTWHYNHFLGVGLMKSPNDVWMYQILMTEQRFQTVIETGTYQGGSALWFAYLMDMLQIEQGHVFTVDIEDRRSCFHDRITFLDADSTDPALAAALSEDIRHPLLVVLDADHSAEHVRKELELYAPLCQVGDWIVVEDTNISWGPVRPWWWWWCRLIGRCPEQGDRGARGGVEDYLMQHQGEFRQDVLCERFLLSMNPGGWLQRVAECAHQ